MFHSHSRITSQPKNRKMKQYTQCFCILKLTCTALFPETCPEYCCCKYTVKRPCTYCTAIYSESHHELHWDNDFREKLNYDLTWWVAHWHHHGTPQR